MQKLGKKEDEYVVALDSELDLKLEVSNYVVLDKFIQILFELMLFVYVQK